jgi:gamma-glutamylcyclotransferase (GGCT)/AIG2-like uncharacterized protein YtfP
VYNVFTYGSLTFLEVIEALTARSFQYEDIVLPGYERRRLEGKTYPGLFESPQAQVDGRLYFDLDEQSFEVLERFEDPIYERREVEIHSAKRGKLRARIYVVPPHSKQKLAGTPWNREEFAKLHLESYVAACQNFRRAMFDEN